MTESWHFCNKAKSKYQIQLSKLNLPGGSDDKESVCNAGDPGSIPRLGRYPGEGNGYPFQYACLDNSMDKGAWQATVHGVTKGEKLLSN